MWSDFSLWPASTGGYAAPRNGTVDVNGGIAMPPMQPAGAPPPPHTHTHTARLSPPHTLAYRLISHIRRRTSQRPYSRPTAIAQRWSQGTRWVTVDWELARYPLRDLSILAMSHFDLSPGWYQQRSRASMQRWWGGLRGGTGGRRHAEALDAAGCTVRVVSMYDTNNATVGRAIFNERCRDYRRAAGLDADARNYWRRWRSRPQTSASVGLPDYA